MQVKLIHITQNCEQLILKCARVSSSNPDSQDTRLLNYCIKHGHWSIFEMASACFEITTSRAISAQILRHRSANFQEFSTRYKAVETFETYEARRQADKNRQSSVDDLDNKTKEWFLSAQESVQDYSLILYKEALSRGIAKECARFLLPMSATTKIYMNATIRTWIHYLSLRTKVDTQEEHRQIALTIEDVLALYLPTIAKACGWNNHFLNSLLTEHEKHGTLSAG